MGAISFSLDENLIKFFSKQLNIKAFVESGTYLGDTIQMAHKYIDEIHSIELSDSLFEKAKKRFESNKGTHLYHGNSAKMLPTIIEKISDKPTLFWLDAHWCSNDNTAGFTSQCPLIGELSCFSKLGKNSVILIDDARLFLSLPQGLHNDEDWPELDKIYDLLNSLSSSHQITFFNDVLVYYPRSIRSHYKTFCFDHSIDWLTIADKSRDYDKLLEQLKEKDLQIEKKDIALKITDESQKEKDFEIEVKETEINKKQDHINKLNNQIEKFSNYTFTVINDLKLNGLPTSIPFPDFKTKSLISIVVPTKNNQNHIEQCLNSILRQTYDDFEIMIQDQDSTDDTVEICNSFADNDSRITIHKDKNKDASRSIYNGLMNSNGYYWTWIKPEDSYVSDTDFIELVNQYQKYALSSESQSVGVFGKSTRKLKSENLLKLNPQGFKELSYMGLIEFDPGPQHTALLLKSLMIEALNGSPNQIETIQDSNLLMKLLRSKKTIIFLDKIVANVSDRANHVDLNIRRDTAERALASVYREFASLGDLNKSMYVQNLKEVSNEEEANGFISKLSSSNFDTYLEKGKFLTRKAVKKYAPKQVLSAAKRLLNK